VARAVIQDENSRAFLVQEPPGTTHARKLYPDSPAWWAVIEGRIRFEVEKPDRTFEVFEATKGSYVFVPERMLHSFTVVRRFAGDQLRGDAGVGDARVSRPAGTGAARRRIHSGAA
jgi:hypothetical protein